MIFYAGTADAPWLRDPRAAWCISRNQMPVGPAPRARGPYLLDSGAFETLSADGGWSITPERYIAEIEMWCFWPGRPDAVGPMDWPCEDQMLVRTGLSVLEHQ
ncbi:hypothetical protein, partial [Nonomuraea sp. NPDC059022]|uniref:deazapurine DNA modification protein DpdA family protein n=1 Tax=Nonomuraea sp. NPDC059022 TaxID=3346705 RepID=UPI0036B5D41F